MARSFYNLKIISSGDRMELYHYTGNQSYGFEPRNKTGRKGKGKANNIQNKKDNLNRARNKIIRYANCNPDLLTFISLTYEENMRDLKLSKHHLHMLCKALQKDYTDFKYLYVLEFQQRGAIHYHMLCNYPASVKTAKTKEFKPEEQKKLEREFSEKYWPYGWVDVRNLKQEGNTNAGLYVSVYLVEDLLNLDLQGSKCYGHSRNLKKPLEDTVMVESNIDSILGDFVKSYDLKYASSYELRYESNGKSNTKSVSYFDLYKKIKTDNQGD